MTAREGYECWQSHTARSVEPRAAALTGKGLMKAAAVDAAAETGGEQRQARAASHEVDAREAAGGSSRAGHPPELRVLSLLLPVYSSGDSCQTRL